MSQTVKELSNQWANPGDILSLLLLIGGNIIQQAIAQLIGHNVRLPCMGTRSLSIAPVAFSFGWAAYAFSNLLAVIGDMRLMPTNDSPAILVNCSNGFARETRSWVLGRLLRDHESRHDVDGRSKSDGGRAESIRIDVFNLHPVSTPERDLVWWLGWLVILAQIGIAILPWGLYGDWGILLVTLCGTYLAATTCAMPQWQQEKWAGRKLRRDKVTCLTRGNGYPHIMVFIGRQGSWDLEHLATGIAIPRAETRWESLVLAILWICLLISVSGLRKHTWFLIAIGGIGMLQNVLAAGISREPSASNFHVTKFSRAPTILGKGEPHGDDDDANVNLQETLEQLADVSAWTSQRLELSLPQSTNATPTNPLSMPQWLASMSKEDGVPGWLEPLKPKQRDQTTSKSPSASHAFKSRARGWFTTKVDRRNDVIYTIGVQGALMELEKWVPTAGLAMVQIFFPVGLKYNDESIRDNVPKKFWQRAYHTRLIRQMAEEKRRFIERRSQNLFDV